MVKRGRIADIAYRNSLHEWGEPGNERECFASIAIAFDTTDRIYGVLLVKAKVYPANKPPELNDDPGTLPADEAKYSGES